MNKVLLFLFIFPLFGCTNVPVDDQIGDTSQKKLQILPLKVTIKGQLKEIPDVGVLIPNVTFRINDSLVSIQVGANEYYEKAYSETDLKQILDLFEENDFRSNEFFFNPYFKYMGFLEVEKVINDTLYTRRLTDYKRRDIKINYFELDSAEIVKFTILSNYLNKMAIEILKDDLIQDSMIVANSLREAIKQADKVYKLNLRNTRSKNLKGIGQLKNLRVLDISGSWITEIPDEIQNCVHLRSILANASRLKIISPEIGQLKKLRNANFGYCKLEKIPAELGKVESLWNLSLGGNNLNALPMTIANLKNVMFFSIDKNQFTEFPDEVLGLESVINLWMHENSFKTVPKRISELSQMSHLLIDEHEIENIEDIKKLIPNVKIIDEERRK